MASEAVSLYIDDNSLRLMVTRGQEIKLWGELPLEPGLVENNVIIAEAEVTARIKQLFEKQKVKTKKIALGLSGLRCFTRPIVLPRLPKEMLDEAILRESQRVLPIPLEEIYLSWQIISTTADQTMVFVSGIPRKTVDVLIRVLHQAGIRPYFMQVKPLLLTRIVQETTAIIVDTQATEFDIVVTVDGLPQTIRSVRFGSGALSSNEKLSAIKKELNRILTFYNANNPEKTLASSIPIFACGDLANEPDSCQSISEDSGHPVLQLPSLLRYPEELDPNHYMANIGLAFHAIPSKKKPGTNVTLNAIPTAYQTKAVSLANVLVLPVVGVAILSLVFLVMFTQSIAADITYLNIQLKNTNQLLQQKQSQRQQLLKKVTDLQKTVNDLVASRDSLTAVLNMLDEQAKVIKRDLTLTVEDLPEGLNLSNIRHVANVLMITGKASTESQILSYSTKLDRSGQFRNVVITDMTKATDIDFALIGNLETQRIGANGTLVALGSLPIGVSLTNVKSTKDSITLDGIAPNSDKVFSYLRALDASKIFTEITINSMAITENGDMNFSLVLKTGE